MTSKNDENAVLNKFFPVTGPPEEPLITAEENSQAKWEIDAPWADLPDLFPTV